MSNSFIFSESETNSQIGNRVKYYLFKDGEFVKIADSQANTSLATVGGKYYVVKETLVNNSTQVATYEYNIYNEAGNLLETIESDDVLVIRSAITAKDGSYVLLYTSSGKVVKLSA